MHQLHDMQALSLCSTFCQIVMACLALTFFLYLSCKGTIFGKINVCFAPTNFIWNFLIPRRIQWNNNIYLGLHIRNKEPWLLTFWLENKVCFWWVESGLLLVTCRLCCSWFHTGEHSFIMAQVWCLIFHWSTTHRTCSCHPIFTGNNLWQSTRSETKFLSLIL